MLKEEVNGSAWETSCKGKCVARGCLHPFSIATPPLPFFSFLFSFILRLISMFITVRVSLVFVVCEVGERKHKGIYDDVMY